MTVEYERDEQLGAALRELELPVLPHDFYRLLRRRLESERAARPARGQLVLAAAALLAVAAAIIRLGADAAGAAGDDGFRPG